MRTGYICPFYCIGEIFRVKASALDNISYCGKVLLISRSEIDVTKQQSGIFNTLNDKGKNNFKRKLLLLL